MNKARQKFARQDQRRIYLLLAGLMVIGGGALGFTLLHVQPVLKNGVATNSDDRNNEDPGSRPQLNESQQFVADMLQKDAELRDKWKQAKNARRTAQRPGHARRRYEQRLATLESALKRFSDSADRPNSIGWGLQQDIRKLKSDPPPLN